MCVRAPKKMSREQRLLPCHTRPSVTGLPGLQCVKTENHEPWKALGRVGADAREVLQEGREGARGWS